MSFSRRRFLAASASLSLSLGFSVQATQDAQNPVLGDKRGDFDAWFGHGAEAGRFISYLPLSAGRALYHVAYDDEWRAETIVGDFNHLAGGGIAFDAHEIGQSQFVPTDAIEGPVFQFGYGLSSDGAHGLRSWHSPQLAAATEGSGFIIVQDRIKSEGPRFTYFKDTVITTDTADVNPITPTGEHVGPHSSREEWEAYPGGISFHQAGFEVRTPPFPGVLNIHPSGRGSLQVLITPESALTVQDSALLVGSMLPSAELQWTAFVGPTPVSETQVRLHQFQEIATGRQFLTAQVVEGDEETGIVSRLYLSSSQE